MGNWYFNRLMTMSVAEVFFRLGEHIRGLLEEKFYSDKHEPVRLPPSEIILKFNHIQSAGVSDSFRLFGLDFDFSDPAAIDWQKDISSGKSFQLSFYRKINIRETPDLSAKCVWEINRMQYLTAICMNYRAHGDGKDISLFMQIIKSWSASNPYLQGVNWYSNIEVNLRLITWFLCWEILDADSLIPQMQEFSEFTETTWLPLIKKHCSYSFKNPSKFSSANNHLISEYAGLFIASSKWHFPESERWRKYSRRGLEKEIVKQHSKNGVNKEEASEYIQFITDFFLLAFIVGERTGSEFSENFRQRLHKILYYIRDLLDTRGNFLKYGDEDDGRCFILDYDDRFNNFKSLLTSGAVLFKDPNLKSKSNGYDLKNEFLFGDEGKNIFELLREKEIPDSTKFYSEEGHFFFRKTEGGRQIYLHFDAAPLGYLSIAAHGHADALSFSLHVDGQPIFVDPGTFTYHTAPEWRSYFTGTLAHNTVRINRLNQAINGGPTLWLKHYKAEVIDTDINPDSDHVNATHNGYKDLGAGHVRDIYFNRLKNEFQIFDTIIVHKSRNLEIEIPFHLHPQSIVTKKTDNLFQIEASGARITEILIDKRLHPVLIQGQLKPEILGWFSDSFLRKEPTNVIYCKTIIDCTVTFKFIIRIL